MINNHLPFCHFTTSQDHSPLQRFLENNSVSDADSSFNCEGLVYRSPPTPPKHTKKSYRKRHARSLQGVGDSPNNNTPSPRALSTKLSPEHSVKRHSSPSAKRRVRSAGVTMTDITSTGHERKAPVSTSPRPLTSSPRKSSPGKSSKHESPSTPPILSTPERCSGRTVDLGPFQTSPGKSTSPALGNILSSLRRSSMEGSEQQTSFSPRIEKYTPKITVGKYTQYSPRDDPKPPQSKSTPVGNAESNNNNIIYYNDKSLLVPGPAPSALSPTKQSPRMSGESPRLPGQSPRYNSGGSEGCDWEWDGMICETFQGTPQHTASFHEIDIERLVSSDDQSYSPSEEHYSSSSKDHYYAPPIADAHDTHTEDRHFPASTNEGTSFRVQQQHVQEDLSIEEESFSPKSSSSPEPSRSSPEENSSSSLSHEDDATGITSVAGDKQGEYGGDSESPLGTKSSSSKLGTEVYRLCLPPDSPTSTTTPQRQAIFVGDLGDDDRPSSRHQLRRKQKNRLAIDENPIVH